MISSISRAYPDILAVTYVKVPSTMVVPTRNRVNETGRVQRLDHICEAELGIFLPSLLAPALIIYHLDGVNKVDLVRRKFKLDSPR